jgi:hypothetical protein
MTSLFFTESTVGGWWGTLVCPRCEKSHTFANPTTDRRTWFTGRHSCVGRTWDGHQ